MANPKFVNNSLDTGAHARNRFSKPRGHVNHRVGEDAAKQQFRESSNVNNIVKKYRAMGGIPQSPIGARAPMFGVFDFSQTYHAMATAVADISAAWRRVPASVRDRFGSTAAMLRFMDDPRNKEEAQKLGLLPSPSPKVDSFPVQVGKEVAAAIKAAQEPAKAPEGGLDLKAPK